MGEAMNGGHEVDPGGHITGIFQSREAEYYSVANMQKLRSEKEME